MMAKMTLKEAMNVHAELSAMAGMTLPIRLSYAISKNSAELEKIVKDVEAQRLQLCEQYANKDESGKAIQLPVSNNGVERMAYDIAPEALQKLMDEFTQFIEQETTEFDAKTVKFDVLEECEKSERYSIPTVGQQAAMAFMLEE